MSNNDEEKTPVILSEARRAQSKDLHSASTTTKVNGVCRCAYIASTALLHGITVVIRNTADFQSTGVPLINPWLPLK